MPRTIKLAVVGTGLAGLTAAHLLKRPVGGSFEDVEFEVHVFEKVRFPNVYWRMLNCGKGPFDWYGLFVHFTHSSWFEGRLAGRCTYAVISRRYSLYPHFMTSMTYQQFWSGYYSHLISLYKSLGIMFRPADFSYSFSSLFLSTNIYLRRITTTMIYNGRSGRAGISKPSSLGGSGKNQGVLVSTIQSVWVTGLFICLTVQLLLCYIITLFHAVPIWRSASIPSTVFRDWAVQTKPRGFLVKLCGMDVAWQDYIHSVLLPLLSAVCTAPEEDVMNHPMEELLGTSLWTYQFLYQN